MNEGYKSVAFNARQQMHAPTRPMSVCHCVMKIGSLYVWRVHRWSGKARAAGSHCSECDTFYARTNENRL